MNGIGVFILQGPQDWEILQHQNHQAAVALSGVWTIKKFDHLQLREPPKVKVRLINEEDNRPLVHWTETETQCSGNGESGTWHCTMQLPAGGLYRLETGLYTDFGEDSCWMERGDARFHIGVGNVFVIAGQSNAAGVGRDSAWDPPSMGVHALRNCGRWDVAAHPLNDVTGAADVPNAEDGVTGTSPFLSFGREFQKLSGYPVGVCMTARGGSGMTSWLKDMQGELYNHMLHRIEALGGKIAGILWYQGCRDGEEKEQAEQYSTHFSKMVRDVREALNENIPFFTFQLNTKINGLNSDLWSLVKDAQRKAANEIDNVFIIPTTDCYTTDLIHNSSSANVALGRRLALQCASHLCGAAKWEAPNLKCAVLQGKGLVLTFSNNEAGFQLFNHTPGAGFTVEDDMGEVPVVSWRQAAGCIEFTLQRKANGSMFVSFAAGIQPIKPLVCDINTYLPILSFYRVPVSNGEVKE